MRSQYRIPAMLVALMFGAAPASAQIAVAEVGGGKVEGSVVGGIGVFKGIPFAAPPTGDLRWRAPQPVRPWRDALRAERYAPGCMQDANMARFMGATTGLGEDCLYLNVWTPAKAADAKLPVMVWIYGGGFSAGMTGSPLYDGTQLAAKGVVIVSIVYRVGPFGFLAHPELSAESGHGSGTFGLMDQIAGLQWVKDNIARFGGDPDRVTIFGESAGGIAVSMLAAAPAAKGLFQRAISQSGGSFAPARIGSEGGTNIPPLAAAEARGVDFLKSLGASSLAEGRALAADTIKASPQNAGLGSFWPVLDGHILPGDQYLRYQRRRFNDTPVLIGTNSDEGALFARPGMTAALFEQQVRAGYGKFADAVLAAYPHATDAEAARAGKDLFRDTGFAWHSWTWAKLQAENGRNRAYVYYFDQRSPVSPDGANHGAEIPFVFGNFGAPMGPPSPADVVLSQRMIGYWTNFARTGDPNGPGLPEWPKFAGQAPQVLVLGADTGAKPVPHLDKLRMLDGYYAWLREKAGRR